MYSVIRIEVGEKKGALLKELECLLKVDVSEHADEDEIKEGACSYDISTKLEPNEHFKEIESYLAVISENLELFKDADLAIDLAIENSDLENRNMYSTVLTPRLLKLLYLCSIEFEYTIYP